MSFLQPQTPYSMKEGILPLFDDPLTDEVQLAMPDCNEYGIVGTTFIYPPPVTSLAFKFLKNQKNLKLFHTIFILV